jgi:fructuronate reductase
MPAGAIRILGAWIDHLRGSGVPVEDAGAAPFAARAGRVRNVLGLLAPDLEGDDALVSALEKVTS